MIVDEFSDSKERFVFDVKVVFLDFDKFFLGGNFVAWFFDLYFLFKINNRIVLYVVVKIMRGYSIEYDNGRVFNLDNVSFMKKVFCDILFCFFCIYIICYS